MCACVCAYLCNRVIFCVEVYIRRQNSSRIFERNRNIYTFTLANITYLNRLILIEICFNMILVKFSESFDSTISNTMSNNTCKNEIIIVSNHNNWNFISINLLLNVHRNSKWNIKQDTELIKEQQNTPNKWKVNNARYIDYILNKPCSSEKICRNTEYITKIIQNLCYLRHSSTYN